MGDGGCDQVKVSQDSETGNRTMERAADCVDLAGACLILANHNPVRERVARAVGQERLNQALEMMRGGNLSGDLGDTIHDALIDPIENDAELVWEGRIRGTSDSYPVTVNRYCGVFWVQAQEYDLVGYFLDRDHAVDYVMTTWEGVREVRIRKSEKT
jgi:hypothetical protein